MYLSYTPNSLYICSYRIYVVANNTLLIIPSSKSDLLTTALYTCICDTYILLIRPSSKSDLIIIPSS